MTTAAKPKAPKAHQQTYEEWKAEEIKLGLDDLDAGRVISHDEFMRESNSHLKRLVAKHGKAA